MLDKILIWWQYSGGLVLNRQLFIYCFIGDIAKFKEHTFCNFEYLLAMADGDHIQRVFNNLEIIKTLLVDSDIHLLNLTLQSSGVGLHSSPLQLANEIIGRMRQIKGIWAASWQNRQNSMCAQRRLRSAGTSAQSDESLRYPHEES